MPPLDRANLLLATDVLCEQIAALEAEHPRLAPKLPDPPKGMKRIGLLREHVHDDPAIIRVAFSRWLLWRYLLARQQPTQPSLLRAAERLRGWLLYLLAREREASDEPLPLRQQSTRVPHYALAPYPAPEHIGRLSLAQVRRDEGDVPDLPTSPGEWWARYGDTEALAGLSREAFDTLKNQFGAPYIEDIGYVFNFEDLLALDIGDLEVARLLDEAWSKSVMFDSYARTMGDFGITQGITGSFDIEDEHFLSYLRFASGELITGIDGTTRAFVAETLYSFLGGAGGYFEPMGVTDLSALLQQFATSLDSGLAGMSRYRAYLIAATETARAESWGSFLSMWQTGVRYKQAVPSAGACLKCITNAEVGAIPLTQPFPNGFQAPPFHPLCFPPGTIVSGPPVLRSMERWYSGPLVELRTAGGHFLTCTPNHPVLTAHGWVAAGILKEGDYVVCGSLRHRSSELVAGDSATSPDEYQVPALIEDVARAVGGTGGVSPAMVETTAEDFHGDGLDGEVCIIRSNGLLRDALHTPLAQPIGQENLTGRDIGGVALIGERDVAAPIKGLALPAICCVGRCCDTLPVLGSRVGESVEVGFALASRLYVGGDQAHPDSTGADAKCLGESLLGLPDQIAGSNLTNGQIGSSQHHGTALGVRQVSSALPVAQQSPLTQDGDKSALSGADAYAGGLGTFASEIQLDTVLNIGIRRFAGHVYNLQTTTGWYIAHTPILIPQTRTGIDKGIIVHNCRDSLQPVVPDEFRPEDWIPRDTGDFFNAFWPEDVGLWPEADLSSLLMNVELPGIDLAELVAQAEVTRARKRAPAEDATRWAALSDGLAVAADAAAVRWVRALGARFPARLDEWRALRMRADAGETVQADAAYAQALVSGLRHAAAVNVRKE